MDDTEELTKPLRHLIFNDEEAARRRQERERQAAQERTKTLRDDWRAPKRHVQTRIERQGQWAEKLNFIDQKLGTGFLIGITGTRGNGKTQLAVEAMRTATLAGLRAQYWTALEIVMRFKKSIRAKHGETEQDIIASLRKQKLLVIDEIAKRGDSTWEQNLLFSLIDSRYADMTDTILIANLEPAAFAECIGPSLASRMSETGGLIVADWPSLRTESTKPVEALPPVGHVALPERSTLSEKR